MLLHPTRLAILEALDAPGSATTLARRLEAPRQKLNYHLRELEAVGLVQLVEERKRGSVCERIYERAGNSYAISTAALGRLGSSPDRVSDRRSPSTRSPSPRRQSSTSPRWVTQPPRPASGYQR